ncbi:hypothetical protein FUAX_44660 (plasmid) [Fulvitalea axinellae]|uniref:RagB/SusD family nutrient uptake outer membrane protein n=1 Tax=Fulvitalea axinellae TaxID=1182444 RepID=A0AAU9DC29_9BACT|nr:hypothetical protein FUAX_44660 [Fulvitalea axinellae]
MKNKIKNSLLAVLALCFSACGLLDITPDSVVPGEKAFNDIPSYQMALNRLYRDLTETVSNMQTTDFASDDFGTVIEGYASTNFYIHKWDYVSLPQPYVWSYQYILVSKANVLTDNYQYVPALNESEQARKDQIHAQAIAIRAWSFFNLVQLYADRFDGSNGSELGIPLKLKLDREYLPQSPIQAVYEQIFSDLDKAEKVFTTTDFSPASTDKAYVFGLEAVRALKARVALFMGDMEKAKENARHFVDTPLLSKDNYWMLWEDQFGSLNKEIIFMTHDLSDTDDADLVDYFQIYDANKVKLSSDLMATFEADDIRKTSDYIAKDKTPYKYIVPVNDRNDKIDRNLHYKHFRVAEQYLIYAEAILDTDKPEALRVVNKLREARGASALTDLDKASLLAERRKELFTEGLRFYDLKRLASELNIIVTRETGEVLSPGSELYNWKIPRDETDSNPHID